MPNKRDLNLSKYGIGVYAYRELNNFCRQYQEKMNRLPEIQSVHPERAANLSRDLEMIEQAAMEAAPEEYELFLLAVTNDVTWSHMRMLYGIRMGQNAFNARRRAFYYLLAKKKGMA